MSCGSKTAADLALDINVEPFIPDGADGSNSASGFSGFMQVMPPEFDRDELQDIRDRARQLSIQGSLSKTMEERLWQQLADIADQLDAIAARWESDIDKSTITITTEPVTPTCGPGCCKEQPKVFGPGGGPTRRRSSVFLDPERDKPRL